MAEKRARKCQLQKKGDRQPQENRGVKIKNENGPLLRPSAIVKKRPPNIIIEKRDAKKITVPEATPLKAPENLPVSPICIPLDQLPPREVPSPGSPRCLAGNRPRTFSEYTVPTPRACPEATPPGSPICASLDPLPSPKPSSHGSPWCLTGNRPRTYSEYVAASPSAAPTGLASTRGQGMRGLIVPGTAMAGLRVDTVWNYYKFDSNSSDSDSDSDDCDNDDCDSNGNIDGGCGGGGQGQQRGGGRGGRVTETETGLMLSPHPFVWSKLAHERTSSTIAVSPTCSPVCGRQTWQYRGRA